MTLTIILVVSAFIFGFLVGRNNPNLKAVNNLISAGKAAVTAAGQVIKK